MRFLIIVKASAESERAKTPAESTMTRMLGFHEQLASAGALLDAAVLMPSTSGWRIRYDATTRTVVNGPFDMTPGLIAGYTLFEARTRGEAQEWSRRFPNPCGDGLTAEIEIRPLLGLDAFAPGDAVKRLRKPGTGG